MSTEKKALMCVFRPERLKSTEEMREWFSGSYHRFLEMDSVESKTWWVNQEKASGVHFTSSNQKKPLEHT